MRYHLVTLGCPKNVVDSEGMAGLLERAGHTPVDDASEAEVLIVNTCGFIGPARDESLAVLRELGQAKRPDQLLIATGCLVQRADGELPRLVPGLDAVLSTRRWYKIAGLVARLRHDATYHDIPEAGFVAETQPWLEAGDWKLEAGSWRIEVGGSNVQPPTLRRQPRGASAYLKIADGCSAPCAFCTIPSIKGPWRSKPVEQVVAEAQELVTQGVLEIVLIAQDTTAYGYDRGERDALAGLIDRIVEAVPELLWLRIMYAFPGRVTPRLVETMARHPQVVKYLDVPLQHGHPATLARMRRPGPTVARRNVEMLRAAMPDIAIRTGFIVGYPGETEEEFKGLLDFVRELKFDRVGVFIYCRESGTPAHDLPGQVPEEVKAERRARVMELQQRISLKKNRKLVGRELEVLIEGANDGISVGRSYRDAPEVDGMVLVQGELPVNQMLTVQISGAMEYDLLANAVGSLATMGV
jgi:ribosomal protein S12 methylthiotransferase